MKYTTNGVKDIRITYIGGGSRGWAWMLMQDLALAPDISGTVALYDIDLKAAKQNESIGNRMGEVYPQAAAWKYEACETLEEALKGADFVVISIMPGTFDEMQSDVHTPEKYGIYQSVGDTVGAGGIIRALRTIPMFETIARAIRDNCPEAWVINYTNPMTMCVRALYRTFPQIKAFGCCHEVFGTQNILALAIEDRLGVKPDSRKEIRTNVVGINHFTWITEACWKGHDLMPIYRAYAAKYRDTKDPKHEIHNWMNRFHNTREGVKFDLFLRFGLIAAAGDRHLAEFCPPAWYLKDPETADRWGYHLTPVSWRKEELADRLARSKRLISGEEELPLEPSGEEGVDQIRALLGLKDLVTNVNLPNRGQIPNLPLDAVVETNAAFTLNSVAPVQAGALPESLYGLIVPVVDVQEQTVTAALERDLDKAFRAFVLDRQVQQLHFEEAKALFDEMIENTKEYLTDYFRS